MEESISEELRADREYCERESNAAYETIAKSQEEYDKQLLTLSTGLLAVIVAFLKDVVHLDSAIYRSLLDLGLSGLALTILLVIISFQISIRAHEELMNYYKARYDSGEASEFTSSWTSTVKRTNLAAGISFIMGVALTICFILVNLNHQSLREADNDGGNSSERHHSESTVQGENGGARFSDQNSPQACPEGKHCSFYEQSTRREEIGDSMASKKIIAHDGALVKTPRTSNEKAGIEPKAPIKTGQKSSSVGSTKKK